LTTATFKSNPRRSSWNAGDVVIGAYASTAGRRMRAWPSSTTARTRASTALRHGPRSGQEPCRWLQSNPFRSCLPALTAPAHRRSRRRTPQLPAIPIALVRRRNAAGNTPPARAPRWVDLRCTPPASALGGGNSMHPVDSCVHRTRSRTHVKRLVRSSVTRSLHGGRLAHRERLVRVSCTTGERYGITVPSSSVADLASQVATWRGTGSARFDSMRCCRDARPRARCLHVPTTVSRHLRERLSI